MPYQNEHACRLEDPDKYDKIRRKDCDRKHDGKCIDVLYGVKEDKSEEQALRYRTDTWGESEARNHCKTQGGTFEPAAAQEKKTARKDRFFDLVQDRAWALHPAKLEEINAFIEARMQDPNYSAAELIEAAGKAQSGPKEKPYELREGGIAILPVYGTLSKRMNLFAQISGGTSYELLRRDYGRALKDPAVNGLVLDIDSPGGAVDGAKETVDFIFQNRGVKPVIAYVNGLAASAGYWIASAAEKIVGYDTAIAGSIGVALTHYDRSEADKGRGIVRTTIYAGKYKRIASDEKPLSEEGRGYLQGLVDYFHSIFTEGVARNRGITADEAAENIANGAEFIGRRAVEIGLIDQIGTLDDAVREAQKGGLKTMDKETLKAEHRSLYDEVFKLGADSVDQEGIRAEAREEGRSQGVEEERNRVVGILDAEGDHQATVKAIKDGVSADGAYKLFYEAEKDKRAQGLKELETSAPESAGQEPPEEPKPKTGKTAETELMERAKEMAREEGLTVAAALARIERQDPDAVRNVLPQVEVVQ